MNVNESFVNPFAIEHPLVLASRVGGIDDKSLNQSNSAVAGVRAPNTGLTDEVSDVAQIIDLGFPASKPSAPVGAKPGHPCYYPQMHKRLKREQPIHRLMVVLKSQGYSNTDISKQLEVAVTTVGNVLSQPWARQRLVALINAAGKDPVAETLRGEVMDSIMALVEVRDNPKAPAAARAGAANSILDRYLGKPIQKSEVTVSQKTPETVEDIDRRLAELRREAGVALSN